VEACGTNHATPSGSVRRNILLPPDDAAAERGDGALNESMWARARQKPFGIWVVAGGLIIAAIANLVSGVLILITSGTSGGGFYFLTIFAVILLIPAFLTLRENRWAYIAGAIVAILYLAITILFASGSLMNPADGGFALIWTLIPSLVIVVVFAVLSFRAAKAGLRTKKSLSSVQSPGGLFTFALIGFVVGVLIAGAIGANVILRNLSTGSADITIVPNAMNLAKAYDPLVFHVAVGGSVAWINKDTTAHTVTSNTTGLFNSGSLDTGATWSHTFATRGTYFYYCIFHTSMWGEIVVS
jgi:plastocyanin